MNLWGSEDLNQRQEDAILEEGSVFLTACPGSGKTRTLTYKIAHELSRISSEKNYVIAITYTNRAADEIHERIEGLGIDTSQLWIGTIHSFCMEWILKPYAIYHENLKHGFRVIDSHEREVLLDSLCEPHKYITHWNCDFYFTETGYVLGCQDEWKHEKLKNILNDYFNTLIKRRELDFELILFYSYELMRSQDSIPVILSSIFRFILIDEYQDTKSIQYAILSEILKAGGSKTNTFIVGDPNQAIYESLGGYPMEVLEFEKLSKKKMKLMELSDNYRSSEKIVDYFGNYNFFSTKIIAASKDRYFNSTISFDKNVKKDQLETVIIRLIKYNVETLNIPPSEICVIAPQWVTLASMTRKLVSSLPEYEFDGPGMVPFARDIENFWYKLSKIALTTASPNMYIRRLRWAGEVLNDMESFGINISDITKKSILRTSNSIVLSDKEGLVYLTNFFEAFFSSVAIPFREYAPLIQHYDAFFESSQSRIERLRKDGAEFIGDINTFRKVFNTRSGITVSTIHGVKGAEFDVVIAYALLEGMVPHFSDPKGEESSTKLMYVIGSRARKNLHLISECERFNVRKEEYQPTKVLSDCNFDYDCVKNLVGLGK
ncbi:UvrD-helicase domain-containing protein [Pelagibaculum spongiae]|uniref:DNA 3'-5' helicase n=1 Tax=Pelagibaculum spongiae TaxID=2080658 RepID=A0A2V1H2J4_9GAMM|nr:ATP-dependent helicase [Pelagibaculum spongiae]PVZ72190.1 ATP-dependent helicase [Pelagibaculum spongiae]